jgi:hypothetical protein
MYKINMSKMSKTIELMRVRRIVWKKQKKKKQIPNRLTKIKSKNAIKEEERVDNSKYQIQTQWQ